MNVEELFEYFRVKRIANLKKRMKRFILTVMLAEEGEIENIWKIFLNFDQFILMFFKI